MAFVAADWTATRATKAIRYVGDAHGGASPSYATVIEFHRAMQDFADDLSSTGDDQIAIFDQTPTDRLGVDTIVSMLNGWNIDDTAAEHLFDGSIIQSDGDEIYDGIVNFGSANTIQLIQNGSIVVNDFWNEAAVVAATSDAARGISHRWMIKTRTGGADIDGRRLIGTQRELGTQYGEFFINGTERGNNVLALNANTDLNNATSAGTIATWTDIVNNNEGYIGIDVNNDAANEFYYSEWDLGSRSKNDFYERAKWLTREGTSETLYGLNGALFRGITHEVAIDTPTGTFQEPEAISWPTGTGQLLAIDSTTAGTMLYMQLLSGTAPVDNELITGGTSSATCLVNVTVTSHTLSTVFVGQSTGSAIIGAYGLGIEFTDLASTDTLTALDDVARTPPNLVSFSINGLVVGEDKVLVAANDSGDVDLDQLSLATTLSGGAETSVVVSTAIPLDTPSSGTIVIFTDANNGIPVAYTSYTGSTFTIASTDFSGDNATSGNDVFIGYIYKVAGATTESFASIYVADRALFIRVRDGAGTPTKTFETTSTLTAAGGSVTVNRISDAS